MGRLQLQDRQLRLLYVDVHNLSGATWVLPSPIHSLEARVRCETRPGFPEHPWSASSLLLPLALAGSEHELVPIDLGTLREDCIYEAEVPELGWKFVQEPPIQWPG